MEESLFIRWVALYALTCVWRREKRGKYTRTLAHLVSPIYTCGRYGNNDISTVTKTPTHLVFAAFAAAPLGLLHPIRERASVIGSADL
jgi:hypothetical protein